MRVKYDKEHILEKCCPHNVNADESCVYVGSNACQCCKYCVMVTNTYVKCNYKTSNII